MLSFGFIKILFQEPSVTSCNLQLVIVTIKLYPEVAQLYMYFLLRNFTCGFSGAFTKSILVFTCVDK